MQFPFPRARAAARQGLREAASGFRLGNETSHRESHAVIGDQQEISSGTGRNKTKPPSTSSPFRISIWSQEIPVNPAILTIANCGLFPRCTVGRFIRRRSLTFRALWGTGERHPRPRSSSRPALPVPAARWRSPSDARPALRSPFPHLHGLLTRNDRPCVPWYLELGSLGLGPARSGSGGSTRCSPRDTHVALGPWTRGLRVTQRPTRDRRGSVVMSRFQLRSQDNPWAEPGAGVGWQKARRQQKARLPSGAGRWARSTLGLSLRTPVPSRGSGLGPLTSPGQVTPCEARAMGDADAQCAALTRGAPSGRMEGAARDPRKREPREQRHGDAQKPACLDGDAGRSQRWREKAEGREVGLGGPRRARRPVLYPRHGSMLGKKAFRYSAACVPSALYSPPVQGCDLLVLDVRVSDLKGKHTGTPGPPALPPQLTPV